ncbi:MAG: hypothetical protein J7M26_10190, partial [Armatimonadetes bacterium]|nr:hypothetical protein [Armatimonadota bacterium]
MRNSLTLALFIALLAGVAIAAPSENLLANGSFEGSFSKGKVPQQWRRYGPGDAQTKLAPSDLASDGKQSLLISDHDTGAEVGVSQTRPLPPGVKYLIASVQVRPAPGGRGVGGFLQLRFLPSNKLLQTPLRSQGQQWGTVRVAGEVPPGTKSFVVYLYTHVETLCDTLVDKAQVISVASKEELLASSDSVDLRAFPPPPVEKLKKLYLDTPLVERGRPRAWVVVPEDKKYDALAQRIVDAIARATGARLPIKRDSEVKLPLAENVIILGNRSTNTLLSRLYDLYYTYLDLKYPGAGGYVVRSLHNPFADSHNAILVGASDDQGMGRAVAEFISLAKQAARGNSLTLGWTMRIKLGEGLTPPENADDAHAWEESLMYRGASYFGWNSLSRRLALYYMTGNEKYLKEFLWLAFPDDEAKKFIWKVDGERIEDKDHPLSGPYHYNAHHMMLLWDLVEESPFFTDDQRLRITRAFAQQLRHWQSEWVYTGQHYGQAIQRIGSRHDEWAAVSLYVLSRYFDKYYPHIVWHKNKEAVEQYFGAFARSFNVAGELDHLFWYTTSYEPLVAYMVLSGDRRGVENGNLETLMRGYDLLVQGKRDGPYLRQLSLTMANKCAYLTGDGRFVYYRNLTSLDTNIFRIGQSFWPTIAPRPPEEIVGKTLARPLAPEEARASLRHVPPEQAYQFASYRSGLGPDADYLLLDGYYGGSRNPYHCLALTYLRHGDKRLLDGYLNQVVARQGGLVEPTVPRGSALLRHVGFRKGAYLVAEVPDFSFGKWRRRIFHYVGHWTLVVDTFTAREDVQNLALSVQWQLSTNARVEKDSRVRWKVGSAEAVLVPWEKLPVQANGHIVRFTKLVNLKAGEQVSVATVLGLDREGHALDCLKAKDWGAVVREGDRVFVATWPREGTDLRVVGDGLDFFHAYHVRYAPFVDFQIQDPYAADALWDNESRTFEIICPVKTVLLLPSAKGGRKTIVDGVPRTLTKELPAGRHLLADVPMSAEVAESCSAEARRHMKKASRPEAPGPATSGQAPAVKPAVTMSVAKRLHRLVPGPGAGGPELYALGDRRVFPIVGDQVGPAIELPAQITAATFWPEEKLLLVGCKNDQLYAYRPDGKLAWTFESVMHPDLYKTGKTYWFKEALPGISGLLTGQLLSRGTQAFVGSACTIEVIDGQGKLIKRLPQYWGSVWRMALVTLKDGRRRLLAVKMPNGINDVGFIEPPAKEGEDWQRGSGYT